MAKGIHGKCRMFVMDFKPCNKLIADNFIDKILNALCDNQFDFKMNCCIQLFMHF